MIIKEDFPTKNVRNLTLNWCEDTDLKLQKPEGINLWRKYLHMHIIILFGDLLHTLYI